MCKEIDEYLKERIKAEQIYSKTLLGAVKKLTYVEDMGDLGKSVSQLQKETEKISGVHEIAAKQFLSLERELSDFITEQNNKRHVTEEAMRKLNQVKQQSYKHAISSKEKYIQRCREKDNSEDAFNNAKQSVTVKTKELEKMEKHKEKSIESMEAADQAYKNSVDSLEQTRIEWEQEMEKTCNVFENLEEGRIEMVRDLLWRCTNIDSQACVDHDQYAENVRQKLEVCDINNDMQEFINSNKTGQDRPARVLYENYYGKKGNTSNESIRTLERSVRRPPHPEPTDVEKHQSVRPTPVNTPSEQTKNLPKDQPLISFDDDSLSAGYSRIPEKDVPNTESGYSSVADLQQKRQICKIIRPYTSKKASEHSVQIGEVVEVVREVPNTATIQIMKNGRIGIVPRFCVEMMAYV